MRTLLLRISVVRGQARVACSARPDRPPHRCRRSACVEVAGVLVHPPGVLGEAGRQLDGLDRTPLGDAAELLHLRADHVEHAGPGPAALSSCTCSAAGGGSSRGCCRTPQAASSRARRAGQSVDLGPALSSSNPSAAAGRSNTCLQQQLIRRVRHLTTVLPAGDHHAQARAGRRHTSLLSGTTKLSVELRRRPAARLAGLPDQIHHCKRHLPADGRRWRLHPATTAPHVPYVMRNPLPRITSSNLDLLAPSCLLVWHARPGVHPAS